jgi:hypothetical protein
MNHTPAAFSWDQSPLFFPRKSGNPCFDLQNNWRMRITANNQNSSFHSVPSSFRMIEGGPLYLRFKPSHCKFAKFGHKTPISLESRGISQISEQNRRYLLRNLRSSQLLGGYSPSPRWQYNISNKTLARPMSRKYMFLDLEETPFWSSSILELGVKQLSDSERPTSLSHFYNKLISLVMRR